MLVSGTSAVGIRKRSSGGIQFLFKFRQSAGAGHGLACDEERRENFRVAMFGGVQVQHEIDEGPFQSRAHAGQESEPSAGEFGRPGEIHEPQFFADVLMVLDREVKRFGCSPAANLPVLG